MRMTVALCGTCVTWVAAGLAPGRAGASPADIRGKWGIGAGVFGSETETSVIRGRSERSAWVVNLSFGGEAVDSRADGTPLPGPYEGNYNSWRVAAGPRLRRFTRPASDLSPYWDLFLASGYSRTHSSVGRRNSTAVNVVSGLGFGLEYFTRWHWSVAADTRVLEVRWDRFRSTEGVEPLVLRHTDHRYSTSFGLSPRLFARGYF